MPKLTREMIERLCAEHDRADREYRRQRLASENLVFFRSLPPTLQAAFNALQLPPEIVGGEVKSLLDYARRCGIEIEE